MTTIAWIGLGNMGLPMASRLVTAGFAVRGFEVNPLAAEMARKNGIETFGSAAEVAREAQIVFTMLPNGAIVEQVLAGTDGVFAAVGPGTLVADCSTIGISTCRKLSCLAEQHHVGYLDAPVSGGVTGAQAGTLTFMVGSDDAPFERIRPFLEHMGKNVDHVGPVGAGLAAKIVNNMVLGINLTAICEAVALGERLGLKAEALFEIVTTSTGNSWAWDNWYPAKGVVAQSPASHNFAPGFKTSLLLKDLGLALEAGASTNVPLDAAQVAHQLYRDHAEAGFAEIDCSSLYLSIKNAADEDVER